MICCGVAFKVSGNIFYIVACIIIIRIHNSTAGTAVCFVIVKTVSLGYDSFSGFAGCGCRSCNTCNITYFRIIKIVYCTAIIIICIIVNKVARYISDSTIVIIIYRTATTCTCYIIIYETTRDISNNRSTIVVYCTAAAVSFVVGKVTNYVAYSGRSCVVNGTAAAVIACCIICTISAVVSVCFVTCKIGINIAYSSRVVVINSTTV